MCTPAVRIDGGVVPVNFDDDEPRRIINLLDKIESEDARFLDAVSGVFKGCLPEGVQMLGPNVHMHMQDDHGPSSTVPSGTARSKQGPDVAGGIRKRMAAGAARS